jgi:hypothetical protein
MKKTKRKKITVETERLLVISHIGGVGSWCEGCRAKVKLMGIEQAAAIAGLSHRALFHMIERHQLHFTETPDGLLLICLDSLLKQV